MEGFNCSSEDDEKLTAWGYMVVNDESEPNASLSDNTERITLQSNISTATLGQAANNLPGLGDKTTSIPRDFHEFFKEPESNVQMLECNVADGAEMVNGKAVLENFEGVNEDSEPEEYMYVDDVDNVERRDTFSTATLEQANNIWPVLEPLGMATSVPPQNICEVSKPTYEEAQYVANYTFNGNVYDTSNPWLQSLQQHHEPYTTHFPILASSTEPSIQGYTGTLPNPIGTLPEIGSVTQISLQEQQYVPCTQGPLLQPTNFFENVTPSVHPNKDCTTLFIMDAVQNNVTQKNVTPQVEVHNNFNLTSSTKTSSNINQKPLRPSPKSVNSPKRKSVPVDLNENRLEWDKLLKSQQFIPPPEVIVMQPVRTRKAVKVKHCEKMEKVPCKVSKLVEHFDASAVEIPMMSGSYLSVEPTSSKRKQKLLIIPGSENLTFEAFKDKSNHMDMDTKPSTNIESIELNEIFKRKKKTSNLHVYGSNRAPSIEFTATSQDPNKPGRASSASFDERVAIPRALMKHNRPSNSPDSDEIDDEVTLLTLAGSTLKCVKCKKLYKSRRSLAIHVKRCAVVERAVQLSSDNDKNGDQTEKLAVNNDLSNDVPLASAEAGLNKKPNKRNVGSKARPITRSQTRLRT